MTRARRACALLLALVAVAAADDVDFLLDAKLATRIRKACKSFRCTLNTVLATLWACLLLRLSEQQQVLVGIPCSCR